MNTEHISEPLSERELEIICLIAKGYSNKEVADNLHLTANTVRWYASQIYDKLYLNNRRELRDYAQTYGLCDAATPYIPTTTKSNLPNPITSFIGREKQIHDVCDLVVSKRLVTLSGPGGTGKTRLSLKVAENLQTQFRDGIHFINLAPLGDSDQVAKAIGDTFDIMDSQSATITETLKRILKDKRSLLILDNFEHVIAAAPLVSELLKATHNLHILVTSREALQLYGEHEYSVPTLILPENVSATSTDELSQNEAILLFAGRARSKSRHFELTDDNVTAIAEICARLDGLPLAIELAAAQIKFLTPQAILKRFHNRLDVLTSGARDLPERQQTIRNTIAWSFELLNESEKMLFTRLSVFRGGRSLEAIEAVCSEGLSIDIFDGLASLVNKNLIRQYEDRLGEPRFWMLETIQEFGLEQLEASDETEIIRKQHALFFCHLAETADPELRKINQYSWFERLEIEYDNIRAALNWTLQGADPKSGVRLLVALDYFWHYGFNQGVVGEADRWATYALEYIDELSSIYQARLYIVAGFCCWRLRSDFSRAQQYNSIALKIARNVDDKKVLAKVLRSATMHNRGATDNLANRLPTDKALKYLDEAIDIWRELGDFGYVAMGLNNKGQVLYDKGDYAAIQATYEECLEVARQYGDLRRVQIMISNLAYLAHDQQDYARSSRLAKEALKLAMEANTRFMMAVGIIRTASPVDQPIKATRLHAAGYAAFEAMGTTSQPGSHGPMEEALAPAIERLSEAEFQQALADGRAMSLDEAVAYALEDD